MSWSEPANLRLGSPSRSSGFSRRLELLERDGEVTVNVETLGFRSAFVGAVLATLPGAKLLPTSPARISLSR